MTFTTAKLARTVSTTIGAALLSTLCLTAALSPAAPAAVTQA